MLVRFEDHRGKKYVHTVLPFGWPVTAAICGRCDKPGKFISTMKSS
jgi:hypothetical protein